MIFTGLAAAVTDLLRELGVPPRIASAGASEQWLRRLVSEPSGPFRD